MTSISLCVLFLTAILPTCLCGPKCSKFIPNAEVINHSLDSSRGFLCDFIWTDKEKLQRKLRYWLSKRQKIFVRFTVPVIGYNNPDLSMHNASGYLTWAWIHSQDTHEYMLYYPHNFVITSTLTLGIITLDWYWDIDFKGKDPASLLRAGLNPPAGRFTTKNTVGYCDPKCIRKNQSCGIGKYELEEFLLSFIGSKNDYRQNLLCLQSPYAYNIQDIEPIPQFAFPDLFYQWRFLSVFYSKRPWLGFARKENDLYHYYCYNSNDECELVELLRKYWIIPLIGSLLWLYSPLLIYYFPSSASTVGRGMPEEMFPSYKMPIYFGHFLKWMLCFYTQSGTTLKWLVRLRRFIFLVLLAATSFHLFFLYPYYSWPLLIITFTATLIPTYLSQHVTARLPSEFMFFKLPVGLLRENERFKEYQQFAYVMQERLYLFANWDFWCFLYENITSRSVIQLYGKIFFFRYVLLTIAFICNGLYLIIPLPYFCVTLLQCILIGEYHFFRQQQQQQQSLWLILCAACCHGVVMIGLLFYTVVALFSWSFALSEFLMFTFIGAALTPNMGFQYFILVGAITLSIYGLMADLHNGYNQVLIETIKIVKENGTFVKLAHDVQTASNGKIVLTLTNDETGYSVMVSRKRTRRGSLIPISQLLLHDGITTYVNNNMYDYIIKQCKPLGRQILFIILKITVILFYSLVAVWVKNVYHLEDKVSGIFKLVENVAVYNLPNLLQFVSYKSKFGKKTDVVLRQEIYDSLVQYLSNIN